MSWHNQRTTKCLSKLSWDDNQRAKKWYQKCVEGEEQVKMSSCKYHSGNYNKIAAAYCYWFDHHKDEAFSFKDSLTALRRAGISFWLVTIMPSCKSRYLPLEKSKGFPAASETTPPASENYMTNFFMINKKILA